MWSLYRNIIILFLLLPCIHSYKKDHGFGYLFKHDPNQKQRDKAEKLTKSRIRSALGGVGIGNTTLFPVPFTPDDLITKFSGTTMHFTDLRMYGLDRIRPLDVIPDFTNLVVSMTLSMDQLNLLGNFRVTPLMGSSQGTFNYTLIDVSLSLEAELMFIYPGDSGKEGLSVSEITKSELTYDELRLNFYDIGILSTILQPVKNSLSRYIFSQIRPALTGIAELNFRKILNKVLTNLPEECLKAVNEVDRALIKARQTMKSSQLDPLFIPDHYPKNTKLMKLELTSGKLSGLSAMKRIGPILIGFERDLVHMRLNLGCNNLKGQYTWTWMLWKNLLTNRGTINFKVEDIVVEVQLEKRVKDEDNITTVENIKLNIGSVNLLGEGVGAVKYIMETFLNVVPDSFRQKISEAAEYRLHKVIEEEFQKIDLENLVEDSSSDSVEGA